MIKESAANASEGNQVPVNMNGASTVPGNVIAGMKGKNVTLALDMGNGIIWRINGKDITADNVNDVNLSVQVGTNAIPQDTVKNVAGDHQTIQINLAHSGDFGYTAVMTLNVDKKNGGAYAKLYYYNAATGKLEFVCANTVAEDGTLELKLTHASDYVIVVENKPANNNTSSSDNGNAGSQETKATAPKTGDYDIVVGGRLDGTASTGETESWNFGWILLAGAVVTVLTGVIALLIWKRADEEN